MIWTYFHTKFPLSFPESFESADAFVNAFTRKRNDGRKIIVVWDEFDRYSFGDQDRWRALLRVIRGLKQNIVAGTAPLLEVLYLK